MNSENLMRRFGVVDTGPRTCDTHGEYTSTHIVRGELDHWSGCPTCAEEESQRKVSAEMAENRRRAEQQRMERMLGYACLPPRFATKAFDTYRADTPEQQRVLRICREYADGFQAHYDSGLNLLMLGSPGTGKTHLAVAILRDVIERHKVTGVYTSAARMFRRIKSTFGSSEESETQAIEAYTTPALLVLDEIGVSYGSDAELNYLFDIMNERYEQCLPTIIVSNIQPDEMGAWLGDRVVDRLRESSRMMLFNWDSARRDIAKEGAQ
ncbi:MAG: ATP-binding protein [Halomonas sp.]|nr:ATP-binding protein [Halomonas sp.]